MTFHETFDQTLYGTVEATLNDVLGEKIARALRFYVDLQSALKNPAGFFSVMSGLVGPRLTGILGEQVVSRLYKRYGIEYKPTGKNIGDELAHLRLRIETQT